MSGQVTILGADGNPLPPSRQRGVVGSGMRMRALNGGIGSTPYDAADRMSPHMAAWSPALWSADTELNPWRDRIVSRNRDVERNDGWAKSGITRIADNVVGNAMRPLSKPDYRALAYYTGNSGFDATWASEFGHALEARWRTWADDVGHYCDAMQCLSAGQLFYLAFRGKCIDGDALAVMMYRPELIGPGKARYATCIQIIDPDRLSNPNQQFDQQTFRGGVEVDQYGVPLAYWIRRAHQGDWWNAGQSLSWDRVPRSTEMGRPIVIHDYDHDRAAQHRGGAGVLTPVLQRLKMLIKYDGVELDAAIINAIFAAYIQSPYDQQQVEQAMGMDPNSPQEYEPSAYQGMRNDFWGSRRPVLGTAQMTFLAPGETIGSVSASRPTSNFEPFERRILLHIAAGMGLTYEQLTGDFSGSNYSSFKGALAEVQKTFDRRKRSFESGFVNPIMRCFVEEVMDVDDMPMPGGLVPDFNDFPTAFSRCEWLGPGRGTIEILKERQGAGLGIEVGVTSLQKETADLGEDWEEIADNKAVVLKKYADLGILPPGSVAPPPPGKEVGDITAPGGGG